MTNPVLIELTASIVAAHVENNAVSVSDLPSMITGVYGALSGLGAPVVESEAPQVPAVSIRSSVKPSAITCLECGSKQRTLKRHLASAHGLAPDAYRQKWNLTADYPMVAPEYSAQRSSMAKARGLGRKPGEKVPAKAGKKAGKAK
ncbi:MAG: transcriptional regulator [Alphaproteobacteria bacterium]|nr:MAG: transcriptional regulator [Alphaproteobacteria bacterium]